MLQMNTNENTKLQYVLVCEQEAPNDMARAAANDAGRRYRMR
jgi:hypothetical protein